ncbi:sulfurtransferase [Sagittula salina]|uniref:Sulfurtransferase n=1 Tax=Sagittula salina TaxID=2820268 RepID=A0A940S2J6_9RHOB|nr:rhodanese-like domain-containing protein [Sagittula salina]MBP0484161.1 sulfurtransferase [Sagittula salina]
MKITAVSSLLAIATAFPAAALDGPLIAPAELDAALAAGETQIIDIRAAEGDGSYAKGHVSGAVNAPYGLFRGPEDNPGKVPELDALQETVNRLGLEPGEPLVITYEGKDATDFGAAARVYWTLKSLGFVDLAILNGGLKAWSAANLGLSQDTVSPEASAVELSWDDTWTATTEEVQSIIAGGTEARLVDARPESFWNGEEAHPAAARPGTLPQSDYFVHSSWFGDEPGIVNAGAARALAQEAGLEGPLVSFCNTGHWAATNWFAMSELAGLDAKLYPESMVGWSNAGHEMANVPGPVRYLWIQIKNVF